VESGSTFSDALGKHPKVVRSPYVNLWLPARSRFLDTILVAARRLSREERQAPSQGEGRETYPARSTVIATIVVVVMLTKVIPVFEKMFKDFGGTLPARRRWSFNICTGCSVHHLLDHRRVRRGLRVEALVRHDRGRAFLDALFLKSPVFARSSRRSRGRFSRTLSTMLRPACRILDALEIVARTAGNVVVEKDS